MSIYDADYAHELAMQEAAYAQKDPAVNDSIAESPVAVAEEQGMPSKEITEQIQEPSDKEINFKALRDSMAEMKAERDAERQRYSQEVEFLRSQMSSQNTQKQEYKNALDDQSDDDLLTVGKYRQTVREMKEQYEQQLQKVRIENEETRARLQYSDYDEVMEKYSIPLLKTNRDFAQAFQVSENKASFAYDLGRREMLLQQYQQAQQQKPAEPEVNMKAQRMVENANRPGTLSNARGGQPSLSKAEYWASCSDADFQKEMERNLAEV